MLLSVALIAFFVWRSFDPHAADFKSFYSAGYAVTHPGIPLYDLKELDENPFGQVFKLPPPAAVYLSPLSLGTLQQARLVWRVVLVAALVVTYVLLARAFGARAFGRPWLGGLAAWMAFAPAQISVGEGQWDPLILLALSCAAVGVASGRDRAAGVAIALAGSVKLYPALAAAYFVGRRSWRGLGVTVLTLVGLMMVGMSVVGFGESAAYITNVLPASGATTAYPDNQSIGGMLARIMTRDLKPFPVVGVPGLDVAIRVVALGSIASSLWLVAGAEPRDGLDRALQLGLFATLTILVLPASWTHYQTVLLLPLFLLGVAQARRGRRSWVGWLILGFTFWLTSLPNPAILFGEDVNRALWLRSRADAANLALEQMFPTALSRLALSYKAFGTLLVLGLTAWRVAEPRLGSWRAGQTPVRRTRASGLASRDVAP